MLINETSQSATSSLLPFARQRHCPAFTAADVTFLSKKRFTLIFYGCFRAVVSGLVAFFGDWS